MDILKNNIKHRLKKALQDKFANYTPESSYMPFHTRLLGKDRMALYSFIQSLNTNFGTTIFEPVAEELCRYKFDKIFRQVSVGNTITIAAQRTIQDIMDALEISQTQPNKQAELRRVLNVARYGQTTKIKPTKVDLFLQRNDEVYLIDIKTAKPNKGNFKEFKRTLLTWAAVFAYNHPNTNLTINTLIAIPYNPYEPKPYERWTMSGMLDLKYELKVADEFWNFLGGNNSYNIMLKAFEEVGIEMRSEIDAYFDKFNIKR